MTFVVYGDRVGPDEWIRPNVLNIGNFSRTRINVTFYPLGYPNKDYLYVDDNSKIKSSRNKFDSIHITGDDKFGFYTNQCLYVRRFVRSYYRIGDIKCRYHINAIDYDSCHRKIIFTLRKYSIYN